MNKFQKRLALWLIDREIRKLERAGIKAWKRESNFNLKKKQSPIQYIENIEEYRSLRELRFNIETINNFWQGIFNPYFKRRPKTTKHVEKLEPLEFVKPELPPLTEEDQRWADMDEAEFMEALDESKDYDDDNFKVYGS